MADNYQILDAAGDVKTLRSREISSVHSAVGLVGFGATGAEVDVGAGQGLPVQPSAGAVFHVVVDSGGAIVTNAGTFPVQVSSALPAGTNVIGKAGIDQTTPGTTDSVSVKSSAYTSQPTVTRPANATPYSAGDVVGGAITFTGAGPAAGHVLITSADLRVDVAAVPSGMANMRLHLYDATPPSAIADNAAWDLPSGDRANYLGYLDLGTPADLGSTLYVQLTNPGLQVKLASASTSLYGYLQTIGAFTPAGNSEVYAPRLRTVGV